LIAGFYQKETKLRNIDITVDIAGWYCNDRRAAGVAYRVDDAQATFGGRGYYCVFENSTVTLYAGRTVLATATLQYERQRRVYRSLRVVVVGHFHSIYVDGVPVFSVVDATHKSGLVGVVSSYEIVYVARFSLRIIDNHVPRLYPHANPSNRAVAPNGDIPFLAYSSNDADLHAGRQMST
jgi:hypothetical protein